MVEKKLVPTNRRNVLKKIGAGATGAVVGIPSSVGATPTGESTGFAYDTLTHKVAGEITGNIKQKRGELRGAVNIAGHTIPVSALTQARTPHKEETYVGVLTDEKFKANGHPLRFRLSKHSDHISGTVTRPGGKYGTLGFVLFSDDSGAEIDRMMNNSHSDPRWTESNLKFSTPKNAIPTDSGVKRLAKVAAEKARNNHGEK